MPASEHLCLRLAIAKLTSAHPDHYAIWVVQAPYAAGYVHHDCVWGENLAQAWQGWQDMFSLRGLPNVPRVMSAYTPQFVLDAMAESGPAGQGGNYSSRLMQHLGVSLWQWVFNGPIQSSLDQSQGMAIGQDKSLRIRLEIRDPELIALPWEIMQAQPGKQAISLSQQLLFSRTTSDVDPLPTLELDSALKILLVLGHNEDQVPENSTLDPEPRLQLEAEASMLAEVLKRHQGESGVGSVPMASSTVDTLIQPTPAELSQHLETGAYNIFFYAGHGVPAPDGGLLFLQPEATLNGTELAQVLTRCRVKLAVFNTCWGAQPDRDQQQAIPRSSLAEVLIHQGVPAVLGMRDSIADAEALSFIQVFTQSLASQLPVDQAMAIARQHLLTLYKFNQPAWTLPVLYMHPEFEGELIHLPQDEMTQLPGSSPTWIGQQTALALLRLVADITQVWPIYGGLLHIGRHPENDLVISEPWVSQRHAEIFYRNVSAENMGHPTYFLKDFSRYGTWVLGKNGWRRIHRQEILLQSGTQLKFGSSQGQLLEFVIEGMKPDADA
ncbi:MAG: CHAT domain-containing protein [Cyanothece sp. SIO1E1]|nr:CHAT domain-containing protein [Cyanothece sp. SIO1E1]